jgi:hypothetical protein
MMEKSSPGCEGGGSTPTPFQYTYLPSRTKLQCTSTLQLCGGRYTPRISSLPFMYSVYQSDQGDTEFLYRPCCKLVFLRLSSVKNLVYTEIQLVCDRICKPFKEPRIDSQPGGFDSLKSIPGLLQRLQIRALGTFVS